MELLSSARQGASQPHDKNWALSWCGRWPLSSSTRAGGISLGKDDACALEDSMHPKGNGNRMTHSGFSVVQTGL